MRLFFLLLLFVFVVLSNRYGLQGVGVGVGVGVLEGEEGVWKQRQSFRRMKPNVSHFFFWSLKNYSSLLALFKYQCHQIKLYNY